MEGAIREFLPVVIVAASMPIVLAITWAAWLGARRLLPGRWWLTLISGFYFAAFFAVRFRLLPEHAMPKDRSTWWLGVGGAVFMFGAILSWVERRRRSEPTAEQMESMREQRVREITGWLREPVTLQTALERLEEFDRAVADADGKSQSLTSRSLALALLVATGLWVFDLYWRLRDGPRLTARNHFERWYFENAREGDELWIYCSSAESWEMLAGECGYTIRRDGIVVEYWMHLMN